MADLNSTGNNDVRIIDHTSDLGIEIFGDDPAALFKSAAQAMFDLMVQSPEPQGQGRRHRYLEIQAEDWPELMFNWLRELLFLFNGHQQVLLEIRMAYICDKGLEAVVTTEEFSPARHRVEREIKAVTYHQLEVTPHGKRWRANIIFDI